MRTALAIVGPTASGKSAVAHEIARQNADIEIVSMDSMQIYKGMDIGTAKPSLAERQVVPYHMIDVASAADDWSVARFQSEARSAISEIFDRGKTPLLVGGTGLYFHAVVDDFQIPPQSRIVRTRIETEITERGVERAYEKLLSLDPLAASRMEPTNARRIARALEVVETTGKPFSSFGPGIAQNFEATFPIHIIAVQTDRSENTWAIEARLEKMRANGFVEEVRSLARREWARAPKQAIGYKEILAMQDGLLSEGEAFDLALKRTRRFARRQRAWFQRDPRVQWISAPRIPVAIEELRTHSFVQ